MNEAEKAALKESRKKSDIEHEIVRIALRFAEALLSASPSPEHRASAMLEAFILAETFQAETYSRFPDLEDGYSY